VSGDNGFQNAPRDAARIANPYVGPRPFDEDEENLFFGRTTEIVALRALITAHRAVLLYAESGTGKTSLLQAGLVPELRREGFEVFPSARVGTGTPDLRPGAAANVFVHNALLQWLPAGEPKPHQDTTIAGYLASRPRRTDVDGFLQPRLLVFDQLEELFLNYPSRWADRKGFFAQVCDALDRDPLLRVLFAVREDFLASFVPYESLFDDKLRNRFRLERLRRDAALAAVRMPLVGTGRSFAPGVAEELVRQLSLIRFETEDRMDSVEGESVEPVQLQVVCQQLWDSLPAGQMDVTRFHLATAGNPQTVLSRYYETSIRRVAKRTRTREVVLRRLFGRYLVTSAGTRGTLHVEAGRTAGVTQEAINLLETARMLRSERRAGARWIEIPHDSLVEPVRGSNSRWVVRRRRMQTLTGGMLVVALVTSSTLFLARHTRQLEQNSARIAWAKNLDVATGLLQDVGAQSRSYGVFDREFADALPDVALAYATAAGLERLQQSASRTTAGYEEYVTLRHLATAGNAAERCAAGIALRGPLSEWNWTPLWLERIADDRGTTSATREAAVVPLAAQWSRQKTSSELYALATSPTRTEEVRYAAAQAYYRVRQAKESAESFRMTCAKDARTQPQIEVQWAAGMYLASTYDTTPAPTLETWARHARSAGLRKAASVALCARLVQAATSCRDVLLALLTLSPHDGREYREAIITAFAQLYLREYAAGAATHWKEALARAP
jgi:hypothetical protein